MLLFILAIINHVNSNTIKILKYLTIGVRKKYIFRFSCREFNCARYMCTWSIFKEDVDQESLSIPRVSVELPFLAQRTKIEPIFRSFGIMDEFWLGMTTYQWHFYDNKWGKELFDVEILYDILKSRSRTNFTSDTFEHANSVVFIPSVGCIIFVN